MHHWFLDVPCLSSKDVHCCSSNTMIMPFLLQQIQLAIIISFIYCTYFISDFENLLFNVCILHPLDSDIWYLIHYIEYFPNIPWKTYLDLVKTLPVPLITAGQAMKVAARVFCCVLCQCFRTLRFLEDL